MQYLNAILILTSNDYLKMSRNFMECVSPEVIEALMLNENETHQKLRKRLASLAAITDIAELKRALDETHIFETQQTQQNRTCIVPVKTGRREIYNSLDKILKAFAETERIGAQHPFDTEMWLPRTNYDEGQIPLYTSILYLQNFRLGDLGRYDFYWFLSLEKTLVVVLTPFLGYRLKPEIIMTFIGDCSLRQKFSSCSYCGKVVPSVAHCCDKTWYCDQICQKDAWPNHRAVCTRSMRHASIASSNDSVTNPESVSQATLSGVESAISAISRLELLGPSLVDKCAVCAASGSLKACKCGKMYCSKACQDSDWTGHKKVCKKLQLGLQASKICSKCKRPSNRPICVKCALK